VTTDASAGALLVDKPSGPTSHDIVAVVRRTLHVTQVGHTGTLDPLATGLLVVLVGRATRLARFLAADEKEYVADVRLGVATPTYDATSLAEGVRYPIADDRYPISDSRYPRSDVRGPGSDVRGPTPEQIMTVLARFSGSFLQTPPPYSAKKVAGVAAYERARQQQPVELKPVPVTVRELEVLARSDLGPRTPDLGSLGLLRLRVAASAGFYVRSLAHDVGQALGCGAHLEALRRTRVGRFRVEDALTLDRLDSAGASLIPLSQLLGDLPAVTLTDHGTRRAGHGNPLGPNHWDLKSPENGNRPALLSRETGAALVFVRLLDDAGSLVAVAEQRADGLLHPVVVLR